MPQNTTLNVPRRCQRRDHTSDDDQGGLGRPSIRSEPDFLLALLTANQEHLRRK